MNKSLTWESERERKKCFPFENNCVLFVHSLISIVQRYESQRTGSGWSFCVHTDSNKLRVTDSVSQTAQKHSSLWHGWNLTFSCWLRLSRQKCRQHEILSGQLGTSSRSSICFFFMRCRRTEWTNAKIKQSPWYQLTGCGYEIEESLLGEQRVFQAPEVEFQDSCHRVDVLVRLVINQRILPCAVITHSVTHFPAVGPDALRVAASRYKVSAIVLSGIKSTRGTVIKTHAGPFLFALWQPQGDDCGFWGEQNAI